MDELTAGALIIAFLGGGIILNVLNMSYPPRTHARVLPFGFGEIAYTILLQLT